MPNQSNNPAPFCLNTQALRSNRRVPGLAVASGDRYASLQHYIAHVADPDHSEIGDYLYVPAFQLVEREEPGAPVEPKVGFTWVHNGVTRVILEVRDDGRVGYASNAIGRRFQVYSTTLERLVSDGYPTKPSRKVREWQPINRVSGP